MILFKRFEISFISAAITLAAFLILCKLGFWQLQRAQEKVIALSHQGELVTLEQFMKLPLKMDAHGKQIQFSGVLSERYWLLDNQTYQGQPGYSVLSLINTGTSELLVNWGWIKAPKYRHELPVVELPKTVEAKGTIKSNTFEQFQLQHQELNRSQIRVQSISEILTLLAWPQESYAVIFADSNTIDGLPQIYKPVVMAPEKHRAYALQWFLLAACSLVIFAFASYKKNNKQMEFE